MATVVVDPARIVRFALAKGTAPTASFSVRNDSATQHVAFKIMTTVVGSYVIQPTHGVLAPRATACVTLVLSDHACDQRMAMLDPNAAPDRFLVRTLGVTVIDAHADDVPALFASAPSDQVVDWKLKCAYTTDALPLSTPPPPPPPPPPPVNHLLVRARARSRSRSRSGSGSGGGGGAAAGSLNTLSPTTRQLQRLHSDHKIDEQRRATLTTFRDDDVRNRSCFNCRDLPGGDGAVPTHVCLDFGIFVCGTCAGIHRGFEHCVKSIIMSKFTDDEVAAVLQAGGNGAVYAKFRGKMDKSYRVPGATLEEKAYRIVWLTFIERIWTGEKAITQVRTMPPPVSSQRRISVPAKAASTSPATSVNTSPPPQRANNPPPVVIPPPAHQETPWDRLMPRVAKHWSWLRDVQLETQWPGDPVCITADGTTSSYEKEMRAKLAFVQRALKLKQDSGPFAGTTMLRGISDPAFPEANLFLAMEIMNLSASRSTGMIEAFSDLESYATKLRHAGTRAHPLLLLALARCAVAMNTKATPPSVVAATAANARELLLCFRQMYPDAAQIWFKNSDNDILNPPAAATPPTGATTTKPLTPEQIEWQELLKKGAKPSDAMDELLKLVGLKRVKQKALQLFKSALSLQKLSPERRKKNSSITLNFCFTGNPGTGKTTVAKLFAQILVDSGMRRTPSVAVCGPQQLKDGGADEFRKTIAQAMGGVVFIDEAYDLDPKADPKGKPIMAELLLAAEELRGDLSIILAGYEDDIQEKLYASNEGLRSRFESVPFDDFDEADLLTVWDALVEEKGWVEENGNVRLIACRRLARGANRKGFGNARAVRQLVESATTTALSREDIDHKYLTLRIVDVIGERPANNPKLHAVIQDIEAKTGWTRIKQRVRELVDLCDTNYKRELAAGGANSAEVPAKIPVALHRLFLGNPGTGKTTFASLYGKLLKHLNLLSNGEVVKKTAGDFIGAYMGQSQRNTCDILQQAK